MNRDDLARRLEGGILLADGGMGTMLYAKGIYLHVCFDELNLAAPDLIRDVHDEYVRAGAELIETNTFGANPLKLRKHGLHDRTAEINRRGAEIARGAAGADVLVAGSIGPLGVRTEPWGPVSSHDAEAAFVEQAAALHAGGVDLFILETFRDLEEIRSALAAVRRVAPDLPAAALLTIGEDGHSLTGMPPERFGAELEAAGADVVGVNCSVGPAAMLDCVERLVRATARPLAAMPNAGIPRAVEGRNIYLCSPDYMAEYAKRFILAGVKLIGGCCGTTPAHIRAMRGAIRALRPSPRPSASPAAPLREDREVRAVPAADKSDLGRRLTAGDFIVSVEIVPPRGHDPAAALEAARCMAGSRIACVNIPDGPRASARMSAASLAVLVSGLSGIEPILHFACRDRNLLGMQSDLLGLHAQGVRNLLVVTGDPPKIGDYPDATAVFDVDSIGLCRVVERLNRGVDIGGRRLAAPTAFLIGVGANPGAVNLDFELERFERKIAAGAEFAITQPVFDVGLLEEFLRRIGPGRIPVFAGIWPLTSLRNAEFMNNEVPGARVPPAIMERMRWAQDESPEAARREGAAIARETLAAVRGLVRGAQICPPLGRLDLVMEILAGL